MNDAVDQIKNRLNIIDVLTPYIELQKSGKHLKARCPFHHEKTPSFHVSPERGMYHCYGCGAGGDMFTFIQAIEGVDFKEALKILAEKAHVELKPVSPERKSERDRLYSILEDATQFYEAAYKNKPSVQEYVKKRGLTEQTIEKWRIGFAPGPPDSGWAAVKEYLKAKGYSDTELLKAGLIKNSDKGKEPYDVFRNRVMFPLFDASGRVVAFSGRTLEVGDDIPKYVNSPETELYKKSELLFGYDKAKHGIRTLDFSLIVEGQFDVVMSHQAGYTNTVAVSGTALTPFHVQQLERLSQKVVLALDADKAGIAAMKRAADLMLRRGLDVKVAALEGGKDPADVVLKDPKDYKQMIGNSTHVIEFLLAVLQKEQLEERVFKLRAREEIIPYITLLPNHIDQDHFEGIVATALKTTKDAVHYEVERYQENKKLTTSEEVYEPATAVVTTDTPAVSQQLTLTTYIVGVLPLLPPAAQEKIKSNLQDLFKQTWEEIEAGVRAEARAEVLFRTEAFLDKNPRRVFEDECVHKLNKLHEAVAQRQLKELKEQQRALELIGDEEGVARLAGHILGLTKARQTTPFTLDFLR